MKTILLLPILALSLFPLSGQTTPFSVSSSYSSTLQPFGSPQTISFDHTALSAFAPGSFTVSSIDVELDFGLNSLMLWEVISGSSTTLDLSATGTIFANNATWDPAFSLSTVAMGTSSPAGPFSAGDSGSVPLTGSDVKTFTIADPTSFIASAQSFKLTGNHFFGFAGDSKDNTFAVTLNGQANVLAGVKITYNGTVVPEPAGAFSLLAVGGLVLLRRRR